MAPPLEMVMGSISTGCGHGHNWHVSASGMVAARGLKKGFK